VTEKELRVSILSFLVTSFRKAVNTGWDFKSISATITCYLEGLKNNGMTEKESEILYLESKIKATEEQIKDYKKKISELRKNEKNN